MENNEIPCTTIGENGNIILKKGMELKNRIAVLIWDRMILKSHFYDHLY